MSGETKSSVRLILRIEGLCILILALLGYGKFDFSWSVFVLFFFAPDLSFFCYLAGPRVGAICYNSAHSYIGAMGCLAAGFLWPRPSFLAAGIIWCAHIGFDRALGYGLKYSSGFRSTHLGLIGRSVKSV